MVTHPDVIISKPRKLLRNVIGITGALSCGFSALCFLAGVGGVLYLILGIALAITAERIKYRYVRRATGSVFELE